MIAKIKTVALVVLGVLVVLLTMGLWDPFKLRKTPGPDTTKDQENERDKEKAKTDATVYKDLAELGSVVAGVDRDNALRDLLDKDYPGSK